MHGSAVFHIAAKPNRQPFERAFFIRERDKVGEGLCRVEVSAVARVDDGAFGIKRSRQRRAFHGVAHHNDVGIAADHANGVFQAFPFGNRSVRGVVKPDNLTA